MKRATRPAGLLVAAALLTAAPAAVIAVNLAAPTSTVTSASTATVSPDGNLSWD